MANPIEVIYQLNRQIFGVRIASVSGSPRYYNTVTQLYETPVIGNVLNYVILVPEVFKGYYSVAVPAGSLSTPATEVFYEIQDIIAGAQASDFDYAPIATGNSQGVNIASTAGIPSNPFNPTAAADICNLALTHIGQKTITSLTDASENARKCNLIFSNCVNEVLRDCSWNFATVIEELTLNADQDNNLPSGWYYLYDIPANLLFVRRVYMESAPIFEVTPPPTPDLAPIPTSNPPSVPYRTMYIPNATATGLVCNINPAFIEYTILISDVTLWDPLFIKAVTFKLAAELAIVLNGKQEAADRMLMRYQTTVSEAMKVNGVEDGIPPRQQSNFVDARA